MLQTLLTGFGPFLSIVSNPAERLANYFEAHPVRGHTVTTKVLPVSFREATCLVEAAIVAGGAEGRPFDVILMLGVASNRPFWSVERAGRNRSTTSEADSENRRWSQQVIVTGAPEILPFTLPVTHLVSALEAAGLPVVASDSAGDYLCNHVLYRTLHYLQTQGHPAHAGFLHIPADNSTFAKDAGPQSNFTFREHCTAVRAVLESLTVPVGDHVDL